MAFANFDRPQRDFPPREMYQGDWACSACGEKITELPFKPSPERPVFCKKCHMERKSQFRR